MEATFEENVSAMERIIKEDRRLVVCKIAKTLGVGLATVGRINHEHFEHVEARDEGKPGPMFRRKFLSDAS